MPDDQLRITLRLPNALADLVRQRAETDHRSLNREIIYLLEQVLLAPVDADAYRDSRHALSSMPRHIVRPYNRRK